MTKFTLLNFKKEKPSRIICECGHKSFMLLGSGLIVCEKCLSTINRRSIVITEIPCDQFN